jgi:hypothetical protein
MTPLRINVIHVQNTPNMSNEPVYTDQHITSDAASTLFALHQLAAPVSIDIWRDGRKAVRVCSFDLNFEKPFHLESKYARLLTACQLDTR